MSDQSTAIFGDFQTPPELAEQVVALAASVNGGYSSVIEPTCGVGAFLVAAARTFGQSAQYYGFDINPDHVQACLQQLGAAGISAVVECRDFYETDWAALFSCLPDGVLIVGNPPWVTNAALGMLGGSNLPGKSNFQRHTGFAAKTGKSNFDISEWMLIRLLEGLKHKPATLAMLCKSATARKVLFYAWRHRVGVSRSSVHLIDALRYFQASVDACLLVIHIGAGSGVQQATIFENLSFDKPVQTFGVVNGEMVSDIEAYHEFADLDGIEYRKWRSGIKHDAGRVMEFQAAPDGYRNGYGEIVHLESEYLFPLLKSSDLANDRLTPRRSVLVTQRNITDDTSVIESAAPETWKYLLKHGTALDARGSSIYANRARFAMFGVGGYAFAPWKVAVSGLYKKIKFQAIGSDAGKPVLLDDTCYFFPCETRDEAVFFAGLLNTDIALRFIHALVFLDSKRAVTIDALKRIDLKKLAERLGVQDMAAHYLSLAPFEEGAQQLMIFEKRANYRRGRSD